MARKKSQAKKSSQAKKTSQTKKRATQPRRSPAAEKSPLGSLTRAQMEQVGMPQGLQDLLLHAKQVAQRGDSDELNQMLMLVDRAMQTIREQGGVLLTAEEQFPLSTPAAAEALDDIESRGGAGPAYRRALEGVLAIDPHSVEALVLLGGCADTIDQRIDYYRRAVEAASRKDRTRVADAMPGLRLRMGTELIDEGRPTDAVEMIMPGLDEDPEDPEGLRFALIELMLRLGWDDDLQTLLDRYPDDAIGPGDFARALLQFRRQGASAEANALLSAAHRRRPLVAPLLSGVVPMPREPSMIYRADSRQEAELVARLLLPGVRDIPGAARWIRDTLDIRPSAVVRHADEDPSTEEAFDADLLDDDDLDQDPLDAALDLPDGDAHWQLIVHREGRPAARYIAAILEDDQLVAAEQFDQRPQTQQLRQLVLRSFVHPIAGKPRKPATLFVPTKADVGALAKYCGTFGVDCRQQRPSQAAGESLQQAMEMISRTLTKASAPEAPPDDAAIEELPVSEDDWLYGCFCPPLWIHDAATPRRGWLQLVVDASSGCILESTITDQLPTAADMASTLRRAMAEPTVGAARRPLRCLADPDLDVQPLADQLNLVRVEQGSESLKEYFNDLVAELLLQRSPVDVPLAKQTGVTADLLERLYETSAQFYRQSPWKMVGSDQLFEVRCERWRHRRWAGCVIGQLGQELGLALYDDLNQARAMVAGHLDLETLHALVIHFDEAFEAIPVDAWYLERNGWKLAGPDAYPFITRIRTASKVVCPSVDDLQTLQQVLKYLPRFLDHPRLEPFEITPGDGDAAIHFRWL